MSLNLSKHSSVQWVWCVSETAHNWNLWSQWWNAIFSFFQVMACEKKTPRICLSSACEAMLSTSTHLLCMWGSIAEEFALLVSRVFDQMHSWLVNNLWNLLMKFIPTIRGKSIRGVSYPSSMNSLQTRTLTYYCRRKSYCFIFLANSCPIRLPLAFICFVSSEPDDV